MDPWVCMTATAVNESSSCKAKEYILEFEDNFLPLVRDSLPDSKEYLAILESKLNKIKSDPNVLQQLSRRREQCMRELLSDTASFQDRQISLDSPVGNSAILRTILPEKQALTQGEIVELIKYDQLVEVTTDSENQEPQRN